jgi:hypothetical protein
MAETVLQEGADVAQWRLCTGGVTIAQYGGAGKASVVVVAPFLRGEQSSLPSETEEWVDAVLKGEPGSVMSLVALDDVEQSVQLSVATPLEPKKTPHGRSRTDL